MGRNDQCLFSPLGPLTVAGCSGHNAPWSIQARSKPISAGVSFCPAGGMTRPFSAPATSRISLLLALSPGWIAGPE
jgi:hypothetical protein